MNSTSLSVGREKRLSDHVNLGTAAFVAIHLGCLGVFWLGVTWRDLMLCLAVYLVQAFGIAAGYHRYFSHRSFKTSRAFQFVLGFMGTLSAQRGVLWWVQHHRHHHRYSDTAEDIHSPMYDGLLYCHSGWGFNNRISRTDTGQVPDLAKYPELVWLDRWHPLIVIAFAAAIFAGFGLRGLVWGFCWGTVLTWHAVSCIVSLSHTRLGTRRYATPDNSRNLWWLSAWTLGESWHNNHHYYPSSARQGFYWWEFDPTYYGLKVLSWLGLVWDLRVPPSHVRDGRHPEFDRRLKAFQRWLVDLRLRLAGRITSRRHAEAGDDAALDALQRGIEARIDGLDRMAFDLLFHGPFELDHAYEGLRTSILEDASRVSGRDDGLSAELARELDTHRFVAA